MIDTKDFAFPKPFEKEGLISLSRKKRREKRLELFEKQNRLCAECGKRMTLEPDLPNSCTLGHKIINKMACRKNDDPRNLQAECWECNYKKGSKRPAA